MTFCGFHARRLNEPTMTTLKRIETFANEFVGFVRVTMEDGAMGWGQVSTSHSDITCQVLHRQVAPWVLGKDTGDLDDLLAFVTEREHKFPGSYLRRAMGGVDTAIWDMRGRLAETQHSPWQNTGPPQASRARKIPDLSHLARTATQSKNQHAAGIPFAKTYPR